METYPYPAPEGIIDLVRKTEFDRLKWELEEQKAKYETARYHLVGFEAEVSGLRADVAELNERLTKQQSDMLDTIVGLRSELASADREIERLKLMVQMLDESEELTRWQALAGQLAEALTFWDVNHPALAAYESATKDELPDPLAEAVKRMEAVPLMHLSWDLHQGEGLNGVRARLIQAAIATTGKPETAQ